MIVFCDLMKNGRMSISDIDETCGLLSHALNTKTGTAVALVIAPYLISDKMKGYRDQLRTLN